MGYAQFAQIVLLEAGMFGTAGAIGRSVMWGVGKGMQALGRGSGLRGAVGAGASATKNYARLAAPNIGLGMKAGSMGTGTQMPGIRPFAAKMGRGMPRQSTVPGATSIGAMKPATQFDSGFGKPTMGLNTGTGSKIKTPMQKNQVNKFQPMQGGIKPKPSIMPQTSRVRDISGGVGAAVGVGGIAGIGGRKRQPQAGV
jgi:hypothetical protein